MEDSELFFGREDQIHDLLSRLRRERFLAVLGDSGSGKSSLIRAGLLPRLKTGFMVPDPDGWRIAVLTPSDDPVRRLGVALGTPDALTIGESASQADLQASLCQATLNRGSNGLIDVVRESHLPEGFRLLVLVDQFEELFRFGSQSRGEPPSAAARHFVRLLLEAVTQRDIPIYVAITMRSEYLGQCAPYFGLPEAINGGLYLVSRMTREQLRDAICEPVAKCGGQISNRLVNRLINDLGDQQDQLPVLQHTLMRLWNLAPTQPVSLDLANLDDPRIDGLQNALPKHVVEILDDLSPVERGIAQDVFRSLTQVDQNGSFVRRPTDLSEICEFAGVGSDKVLRVINQFRKEGRSFLTPAEKESLNETDKVDISHESLIRQWQELRDWTLDEHKNRQVKQRLVTDSQRWAEKGRGSANEDEFFLSGVHLQEALEWRTKRPRELQRRQFALEREFLDRSERRLLEVQKQKLAAERTQKRLIVIGSTLLVLLAAFICVGTLYWFATDKLSDATEKLSDAKKQNAESERKTEAAKIAMREARRRERVASAVRLAAESSQVGKPPINRLLLSFEAIRAAREAGEPANPDAEAANLEALQALTPLGITSEVLWSHDGSARAVAVNDDMQLIASGGDDRVVRIWNSRDGGKPTPLRDHVSPITAVAISKNGQWLVSGSEDGEVFSHRLKDGRATRHRIPLGRMTGPVTDIEFSRDSEWVVVGSRDQVVRAWDLKSLPAKPEDAAPSFELSGHRGAIVDIEAFELDHSQFVVTGSSDQTARVWNLSGLRTTPGLQPQSTVLTCSSFVTAVAIGDKGGLATNPVIAVCAGTISLWRAKVVISSSEPVPSEEIPKSSEPTNAIERFDAVSFSRDGKYLLARTDPRTNQLKIARWHSMENGWKWDRVPGSDPAWIPTTNYAGSFGGEHGMVMQSPDGQWLVASRPDGRIHLQAVTTHGASSTPIILGGHDGALTRLSFRRSDSPGETASWQMVSTGSDGAVRIWNLSKSSFVDQLLPLYTNTQLQADFGSIATALWTGPNNRAIELYDLANEWRLRPENTTLDLLKDPLTWLSMDIPQSPNELRALAVTSRGLWLIPIVRQDEHRKGNTSTKGESKGRKPFEESQQPILVATNPKAPCIAATFRGNSIGENLIRVYCLSDDAAAANGDKAAMSPQLVIRNLPSSISSMSLSSHGRWLAAFSEDDQFLRVWVLQKTSTANENADAPAVVIPIGEGLRYLRFTPNGKRLVAITRRGAVQNWDVESPLHLPNVDVSKSSRAHDGQLRRDPVGSVIANAVALDDRWLVAGTEDNGLGLWDLRQPDAATSVSTLSGLPTIASAVALSPDGRWCAAGTSNGGLYFWDVVNAANSSGSHGPSRRVVGHGSIARLYFQDSKTVLSVDNHGLVCRRSLPSLASDPGWEQQQESAATLIGRNLTASEWKTSFQHFGEDNYHKTFLLRDKWPVHHSERNAVLRTVLADEPPKPIPMQKLLKLMEDDGSEDVKKDADQILAYEHAVDLASVGKIEEAASFFEKADPKRLTSEPRIEAQRFAINHLMSEAIQKTRKGNSSFDELLDEIRRYDPSAYRVTLLQIRNARLSELNQKIVQLLWQPEGQSAAIDAAINKVHELQRLLLDQPNPPMLDQLASTLWNRAVAFAQIDQIEFARKLMAESQELVARPGVVDVERRLIVMAAAKTFREAESLVEQGRNEEAIRVVEDLQKRHTSTWPQSSTEIVNIYRAQRLVTEAYTLAQELDDEKRNTAIQKLDKAKNLDKRYSSDFKTVVDTIQARKLLKDTISRSPTNATRATFRLALRLEPNPKIDTKTGLDDLQRDWKDPKSTIRQLQDTLKPESRRPIRKSEIRQAVTAAGRVDPLVARALIDGDAWNRLCWFGSLEGMAQDVKFAGEIAVETVPTNITYRDTRGLARALTGDIPGAIEDFDLCTLTWRDVDKSAERADWAQALRSGKAVHEIFTPELLKRLKGK